MSNGKGTRRKRAASGQGPRTPGTGQPVQPVASYDTALVPAAIRRALPERQTAHLVAEARKLRDLDRDAAMRRLRLVQEMRQLGLSWDSCGWVLGVTGAAVRQMYAGHLEAAAP